jgi:molybdenum cofactor cytidylyltransferase
MPAGSGVVAVVTAAGSSRRMGQCKLLLPYAGRTVIEHIVSVLLACGLDEVLVVTGRQHAELERCLAGRPARLVYNPHHAAGEMLSSVQAGLRAADASARAALVALGDQPAIEAAVVDQIIAAYASGHGSIVFPSYQMRRGHPLLIDRRHWPGILDLGEQQNLRHYFRTASQAIHHVVVNSPSVLQDMDTPAEYQRALHDYALRNQSSLVG